MAIARLVPSILYNQAGDYYLEVSNENNAFTNTDSDTYATVENVYSSTSNRYVYLQGFNWDAIPSGAIINSFRILLKARESNGSTSSSYRPVLAKGTSIYNNAYCSAINTTATVHEFTFTQDFNTFRDDGKDFGIRINCRRGSRNTVSHHYIYGAEILVDYTMPVYHSVTINNSTSATVTTSDANPLEGTDVEIRANTLTGITVKDNGVDVTSQFVQKSEEGESYSVENVGTYGFTLNSSTGYYVSNNKGVDKSAAVCRVDFHVPVSATITFSYINYAEQGYDFGIFGNIDVALNNNHYAAGSSGATISDSSYKRACNTSSYNSSSVQTLTYDMSAGNHSIWVKFSKDDASASNNDTLQFKVAITLNEPFTPGTYYSYDITNITADHVITVTSGGEVPRLFIKMNGAWKEVVEAYKKVNGTWVEQSDLTTVFNSTTNYKKGN